MFDQLLMAVMGTEELEEESDDNPKSTAEEAE